MPAPRSLHAVLVALALWSLPGCGGLWCDLCEEPSAPLVAVVPEAERRLAFSLEGDPAQREGTLRQAVSAAACFLRTCGDAYCATEPALPSACTDPRTQQAVEAELRAAFDAALAVPLASPNEAAAAIRARVPDATPTSFVVDARRTMPPGVWCARQGPAGTCEEAGDGPTVALRVDGLWLLLRAPGRAPAPDLRASTLEVFLADRPRRADPLR